MASAVLVPYAPTSAGTVRSCVDDALVRAGVPEDVRVDAAIVASELVANALRHAAPLDGRGILVAWDCDRRGVTLRVTDGGSAGEPHVRAVSEGAVAGRGLAIVEALADAWGVTHDGSLTTVWVRLGVRVAPPARVASYR